LVGSIVNGSVKQTVISKKFDLGVSRDPVTDIIDVQEEHERTKYCSLGNTRSYWYLGRTCSIYDHPLGSIAQPTRYPVKGLTTYPIPSEFPKKPLMRDSVKCLGEV
jgi:hypothetical protein